MNDAALLDSLHAALRNPDLAWYTEFHAGESIVAGYLDSLTDPYDDDAIQVPEGWFRYSVVTREGDHALPWMEHWNEYEYSITHHIDWNGKGFTPYDLYCTQDLTGMIAGDDLTVRISAAGDGEAKVAQLIAFGTALQLASGN